MGEQKIDPSYETARTHYLSARTELVERIKLREHILLFYIGAVGTALGLAFGKVGIGVEILLALPIVSFSVAILVAQHNSFIGYLGQFCAEELEDFYTKNNIHVPQWDNSNSNKEFDEIAILMRMIGHCAIILIPAIASLILNINCNVFSSSRLLVVWIVDSILIIISYLFLFMSYKQRKETFMQRFVKKKCK